MSDLKAMSQSRVLGLGHGDVHRAREKARRRRILRIAMLLTPIASWLWLKVIYGKPLDLRLGSLPAIPADYIPAFILIVILSISILAPLLGAGRSPHILFRSSEIDISLDDVKGADVVVDEVVKTLNLFLAHKTFKDLMGGTSRRAILFEGPPGTGKTYMAKAMAKEANVPFLFVSSSAFQSMYYGQTNRKIRSYFKALRKAAVREGGAIGFIEEIDAIGASRSGMGGSGKEGVSGVVNELLIQLQSFEMPTRLGRVKGYFIDLINRWLPSHRQLRKKKAQSANVLVVGATNRAADLDPALLRPGRFDRSIYFDLPTRSGRRDIIDYYLGKKKHETDLDDPAKRDALAAMTFGYSPVMIEHLLDEALVFALRRQAHALGWPDIQKAKMTEEIGLAHPVEYTVAERRTIATHESGHATVAHLVGHSRKLEVLSIIKRKDALGLLAHSEKEERFTRSQSEIEALLQIAMGGLVAEEAFFGETTTGVAGDLQTATEAAAQMVGSLGMAGSLVSLEALQGAGGANLVAKVLSTDEGREKVNHLLNDAKEKVTAMLADKMHIVEALRDALLERDELLGEEITEIITAAEAGLITPRTSPADIVEN